MIEFVVLGTPLSQGASPQRKRMWMDRVAAEASKVELAYIGSLRAEMAYFCPVLGVDIDNIIKPILDAMKRVLYPDDRKIVQVRSIAIELSEAARITQLTPAIARGLDAGGDFVLVRIDPALPTEDLL